MREAQFWKDWVEPALRGLDPRRIETADADGIPDVNYVGGWVELKDVEKWPARPRTPLRLDHYTQQQKVWAIRRRHHGGRCDLLLRVGSEVLLFRGEVAARYLGNSPEAELRRRASATFENKQDMIERLRYEIRTVD